MVRRRLNRRKKRPVVVTLVLDTDAPLEQWRKAGNWTRLLDSRSDPDDDTTVYKVRAKAAETPPMLPRFTPLRRAQVTHSCEICGELINKGQDYYDAGGYRKAHEECVK